MRISTRLMFDTSTQNLLRQQSELYKLQNQMSTGRRILTPADDPVAAAQALVMTQQQNVNQQFLDNQGTADSLLTEQEDRLQSISDLLQSVKDRLIQAGNGAYKDSDRKAIASEIRQRYDELLGLANSTDAMGNYVFSGMSGDTKPFSVTGTPGSRDVTYLGDEGRRQLQVATGRIMDVSESGDDVFMRIPQGNGTYMLSAGTSNTGTGVVGSSSLAGTYTGATYELDFQSATAYQLKIDGVTQVDASSNPIVYSYTAGSAISLPPAPATAQVSLTLSGAPNPGDTFTLAPSANQDIFETLDDMIAALEGSIDGNATARVAYQNQIAAIGENLDQALDHVLTRQTSIGARRVELDALTSFGGDLDLQYQSDLSKLQDLDYAEAITSMLNRKMALEAAQSSFSKVSQMSLFSYL